MSIAYFYKIYHLPTQRYYVGCQYGRKSDPLLFWKEYFTSSKYVHELIKQYGKDSFKILKIIERPDAREYERRYLKLIYKHLGREKFLEKFINRNTAPGIILTTESIKKISEKAKGRKQSKESIKKTQYKLRILRETGKLIPFLSTDKGKKLTSKRMKSPNHPMKQKKFKEKMSKTTKRKIESGEIIPYMKTPRGKEYFSNKWKSNEHPLKKKPYNGRSAYPILITYKNGKQRRFKMLKDFCDEHGLNHCVGGKMIKENRIPEKHKTWLSNIEKIERWW